MSLSETPRRNGHAAGRAGGAPALRLPAEIDSGEPVDRFSFVYPHQIVLMARQWLVACLLPRLGFGVLFGPSGCGKSFWAIYLALCVALGLDFLGRRAKQAGVIIVAAEDAEGVKFRVIAALKALRVEPDPDNPLPLAIVPEAPDLWSEDGDTDALIAAIKAESAVLREYGAAPGLIIIDTMRDALPGMNENGSDEMSRAVRTFRRIGEEVGALVLVVHHVPRGGDGEDPRGSTALIGAADVALGVRLEEQKPEGEDAPPGPPERVLWLRKQRNGPDAKGDQSLRWAYSLQRVELDIIGEDGEPEASCAVRVEGAPSQGAPKFVKLSAAAKLTEQAIVSLLSSDKGEHPPADIPCPADRQAVRVEAVREEARRLGISDAACANPAEAVRKAVARAKQELISKHRVFEADGWIWRAKQ